MVSKRETEIRVALMTLESRESQAALRHAEQVQGVQVREDTNGAFALLVMPDDPRATAPKQRCCTGKWKPAVQNCKRMNAGTTKLCLKYQNARMTLP